MKLLRKIIVIVLALAALAFGVLFALQNKEPVALDVLVHTFAPRSLALWLLLAFALGGVVGMLASSLAILRLRTARASANRQLQRANTELDRLRTAGLTGSE